MTLQVYNLCDCQCCFYFLCWCEYCINQLHVFLPKSYQAALKLLVVQDVRALSPWGKTPIIIEDGYIYIYFYIYILYIYTYIKKLLLLQNPFIVKRVF